jgi:hypothetical protein
MTQAKDIAKRLRAFLNQEKLTLSDLRRGMVILSNGKLSLEARNPVRSQLWKPTTQPLMDKGLEGCST